MYRLTDYRVESVPPPETIALCTEHLNLPVLPRQVWINPPPEKTTPQEALGATFSGRPIPELPPDSSYPGRARVGTQSRPHRAHAPSFTDRGSLNAACGCLKVVDTFRLTPLNLCLIFSCQGLPTQDLRCRRHAGRCRVCRTVPRSAFFPPVWKETGLYGWWYRDEHSVLHNDRARFERAATGLLVNEACVCKS